jgi:tungstate transport system substrate-binding protein
MAMRKIIFGLIVFLLSLSSASAEQRIICASTTSTQNSGLFDHILPMFRKSTGITVHVVAVGTGAAIEMGKRGDADVVIVHAKDIELDALKEGHFINRHDLMYNDFVIAGPAGDPAGDPAGVKEAGSAVEAFKRIAASSGPFVSRGDGSGTHRKELSLWAKTDFKPEGRPWYLAVGQGMAKTLRIANEKRAYTLTDRATWLSEAGHLGMEVLFEGDPALFNQYGVMAVNPERQRHVRHKEAERLINWLISEEGQGAIGSFRDGNGNRLFVPNAKPVSG